MMNIEMEILREANYANLSNLYDSLIPYMESLTICRDKFIKYGELTEASKLEMELIVGRKDVDNIKLLMTAKEADALESFKFGMEPLSKN